MVVRNIAQLLPGDRLVTSVQHGRITSRVEELHDSNAAKEDESPG
jgi:hypothetical protein